MTAHFVPQSAVRSPSSREAKIRAYARENATVAAALGLHDNNGLDWTTAMECLVLELLARPPLVDRDDDGLALCCGELVCRCPRGRQ